MSQTNHKHTTLIIDDEIDICFLLSNILRQKDIGTHFASSLSEATYMMDHNGEFAYIFIDNHLPDGFGVDYIQEIKRKCPTCKIIMITAHDNASDRQKANDEGVDYFIGKPFSRDLIFKTLEQLSV